MIKRQGQRKMEGQWTGNTSENRKDNVVSDALGGERDWKGQENEKNKEKVRKKPT